MTDQTFRLIEVETVTSLLLTIEAIQAEANADPRPHVPGLDGVMVYADASTSTVIAEIGTHAQSHHLHTRVVAGIRPPSIARYLKTLNGGWIGRESLLRKLWCGLSQEHYGKVFAWTETVSLWVGVEDQSDTVQSGLAGAYKPFAMDVGFQVSECLPEYNARLHIVARPGEGGKLEFSATTLVRSSIDSDTDFRTYIQTFDWPRIGATMVFGKPPSGFRIEGSQRSKVPRLMSDD